MSTVVRLAVVVVGTLAMLATGAVLALFTVWLTYDRRMTEAPQDEPRGAWDSQGPQMGRDT
jgi:hypothetical protein